MLEEILAFLLEGKAVGGFPWQQGPAPVSPPPEALWGGLRLRSQGGRQLLWASVPGGRE